MCFSATASFMTAAVAGSMGVIALTRTRHKREWPLAATPLLFAAQQTVEGLLWLTLPIAPDRALSSELTLLFLLVAEVFWPIYAPLAVLLIEPEGKRRAWIRLCLAAGIGVAAYLLWAIVAGSHRAEILDGHIVYRTGVKPSILVGLAYLAATGLSLLLSSQRTVIVLGAIVLVGSTVAYAFYWEAFVSVWCFFAAAASVVVLGHFEVARRLRQSTT